LVKDKESERFIFKSIGNSKIFERYWKITKVSLDLGSLSKILEDKKSKFRVIKKIRSPLWRNTPPGTSKL